MSKEYFTDNLTDENMAEMIDKVLRFEKNNKPVNLKTNLLKIIPAVAMVALVIGLINILPVFLNSKIGVEPGSNAGAEGVISNESNGELTFVPAIIEKTFFEEKMLGVIPHEIRRKMAILNDKYSFSPHLMKGILIQWRINFSYVLIKDADDILNHPLLKDSEKEKYFAICEKTPVYIFNPYASEPEINNILDIYREYTDLTDADIIQMAEDYDIPVDVLYAEPVYYESDEEWMESDAQQAEYSESYSYYVTHIEPVYGMNTNHDGTEHLVFKNQSLQAAITKYLVEYCGFWWDDYITPDMLAQINSIEVKISDAYSYIYDSKNSEGVNLSMRYIEYTINGKTLDMMPNFAEGGGFLEFTVGDMLLYFAKIDYGIADTGYEIYYYNQKVDLNIGHILPTHKILAASYSIAVYTDSDGNYFTVAEFPSMFGLELPARYDDKNEYDTSDMAYMPNLTEFNINGISVKN